MRKGKKVFVGKKDDFDAWESFQKWRFSSKSLSFIHVQRLLQIKQQKFFSEIGSNKAIYAGICKINPFLAHCFGKNFVFKKPCYFQVFRINTDMVVIWLKKQLTLDTNMMNFDKGCLGKILIFPEDYD